MNQIKNKIMGDKLNNRRDAIEWWERLYSNKKESLFNKYYPLRKAILKDVDLTGREIELIWKSEEIWKSDENNNLRNEKLILIDKLLHDFRLECLPFGEYPDYILIDFKNKWIKKNLE